MEKQSKLLSFLGKVLAVCIAISLIIGDIALIKWLINYIL